MHTVPARCGQKHDRVFSLLFLKMRSKRKVGLCSLDLLERHPTYIHQGRRGRRPCVDLIALRSWQRLRASDSWVHAAGVSRTSFTDWEEHRGGRPPAVYDILPDNSWRRTSPMARRTFDASSMGRGGGAVRGARRSCQRFYFILGSAVILARTHTCTLQCVTPRKLWNLLFAGGRKGQRNCSIHTHRLSFRRRRQMGSVVRTGTRRASATAWWVLVVLEVVFAPRTGAENIDLHSGRPDRRLAAHPYGRVCQGGRQAANR